MAVSTSSRHFKLLAVLLVLSMAFVGFAGVSDVSEDSDAGTPVYGNAYFSTNTGSSGRITGTNTSSGNSGLVLTVGTTYTYYFISTSLNGSAGYIDNTSSYSSTYVTVNNTSYSTNVAKFTITPKAVTSTTQTLVGAATANWVGNNECAKLNFTIANSDCTITFSAGTHGSVSPSSVTVPYGTTYSASGNTMTFSNGTTVTATPNSGYGTSWSPTSGTVTSSTTFYVSFSSNVLTIFVNAGTGGTATGGGSYPEGEEVTLSATPNTGYEFVNWTFSGGTSTNNPYVFTVNPVMIGSTVTYTANFSVKNYTVTISAGTHGSTSTSSVTVAHGTTYSASGNTLTFSDGQIIYAYPDNHYNTTWSSSSGTITGARTISASFTGVSVNISFNGNGGTPSYNSNTYTYGSIYGSLPSASRTNYTFDGWYTSSVGGTRIYTSSTVTYYSSTTLYAHWTQNNYTVTISAGSHGSVYPSSVSVAYGTTYSVNGNTLTFSDGQTVTASPDTNYATSWSPTSGTITGATTISATFNSNVLIITVTSAGNGTATGSGTFHAGDYTNLVATPDPGYEFAYWNVNGTHYLGNPYQVEVQSVMIGHSMVYEAVFVSSTNVVTISAGSNGTVDTQSVTVARNTTYMATGDVLTFSDGQTVTATPNTNYQTSWSPTSGTITSDTTITVTFSSNVLVIIVASAGNGTATGSGTFHAGDYTNLVATPDPGYDFAYWDVQGTHYLGNPYQVEVQSVMIGYTMTYTAVFTQGPLVTFTAGSNGTVDTQTMRVTTGTTFTSSGNVMTFSDGRTVTATPSDNYGTIWNPSSGTIMADTTIALSFTGDALTIIVATNGHGTATGSGTFVLGDYTNLVATPDPGYDFAYWDVEGYHYLGNPYQVEVREQMLGYTMTYTAIFVEGPLVTFSVGLNGSLDSQSLRVSTGTTFTSSGDLMTFSDGQTVTATPDTNYTTGWSPASGTVTSDMTVTVTFTNTALIINVVSAGNGSVTGGGTYHLGDLVTLTATPDEGYIFERWTFTNGSSLMNPYIFEVVEIMLGYNVTYTANFVDAPVGGDVWWDNGYINGKVDIEFWFENTTNNQTHTMIIPFYEYDGIDNDADGVKNFTKTDNYLQITVPYHGNIVCTLNTSTNTLSSTYSSGTWLQFTIEIDAQKGKVLFNGTRSLGWNQGQEFNFTNYTTVFSKEIFDFSDAVNGLAIKEIYHEDTGIGSNHVRFQVSATTTYLDTYGYVMVDPVLNIYEKFPDYDDLRLNFYSFAVYGDTVTFNGRTFHMDGSQITDLYYTMQKDENNRTHYVIADQYTAGAIRYQPFLTNLYITWENISSQTASERQCYITFVNDSMTIELGTFNPLASNSSSTPNMTVSMTGIWYFTTAIYEPYQATERIYTMDWNSWFNLDGNTFIVVVIAIIIVSLAVCNRIWELSFLDYAVAVGGAAIAFILIGGF